jgi:polysaccharide biosynthesis transport protein
MTQHEERCVSAMTRVMEKIQDTLTERGEPGPQPRSGFIPGDAAAAGRRVPRAFLDVTTQAWDPQKVDPVVVAFHERYASVCEQYRSVRARLLTMNTTDALQVLAITSSVPQEGKSVTTANLGIIMAEGGEHRILIADADFRRTSIARLLGIPSAPGLADVLRGEVTLDEALQPSPLCNLKILPAGRVADNNYGDLLGGPGARVALEALRERFDYTFVDTPPVKTVSDVCLLAPHCDGALLVIEMGRTPEPTVQQAVRTLQANNVRIVGTLLSRFRERGAGTYDRYYYASGYGC